MPSFPPREHGPKSVTLRGPGDERKGLTVCSFDELKSKAGKSFGIRSGDVRVFIDDPNATEIEDEGFYFKSITGGVGNFRVTNETGETKANSEGK